MPVLRYWDAGSSAWVNIGGGGPPEVYIGTNAPSPRDQQVLWVDTDEPALPSNYYYTAELVGPWSPAYVTWSLPFKADVLLNWSASWWAPAVGMSGCNIYLDSGFPGQPWAYYYFNEAGSHKEGSSSWIIRGMAAGNHTWGVGHAANATSDANDRAHLGWTCVAVP
jgi:hypothetical protein